MKYWDEVKLEEEVLRILKDIRSISYDDSEFGRPYLTSYQIAIKIINKYPNMTENISIQGESEIEDIYMKLAKSIEHILLKQISSNMVTCIEYALLADSSLCEIKCTALNLENKCKQKDIIIFRYNDL